MEWGAAVTAIITLIIALMKWWQSRQPERDQENRYDVIQQGRNDIANGDVDAVNGRIDQLLSQQSDDSTGQRSTPVTAERINAVVGMVDSGRSSGADTGKSGIL